jgi:hypothetical protein
MRRRCEAIGTVLLNPVMSEYSVEAFPVPVRG